MSAAASPKLHLKKSPTLKDKDWEPFKSLIINLHITKGYSIKQVQQHMKDKHDFVASPRQYRSRITKWELDKKVKAIERQFILRRHGQRRLQEPGKKDLVFKVRGTLITKCKIKRWIREDGGDTIYTGGDVGAAPPGVGYLTDSESESSAPVSRRASPMRAAETSLAIPGPNQHGVVPDSSSKLDSVQTSVGGGHTDNLTNQETVLGMDFGLPVSAIEDSEWWQKMLAVPTLLVGNAHFLRDSPPPILPQCLDDDVLLQNLLPFNLLGPGTTLQHAAEDPHWPDQNPLSVLMNQDLKNTGFALDEDKYEDLLSLIDDNVFKFTRDNKHGPFTEQAQKLFLVGDRQDQDHPLSRTMMQTYLLSYWENFSDQVPILHRPTFNPDTAPVILLVAMIAIGAATFNTKHGGSSTTAAGMCLPNYLAWGVRWETFRDQNFRAPASLWALQASILLETYEALYSTGDLHERAVIYHPSTIQLVRWGRSLAGTAGDSKLWTPTPAPASETQDAIDSWWRSWITTEATRRLAFASFVVDSMHSTIFGNSSIMTFHEVRIPLPCDDELWNSTSGDQVRQSMARSMAAGAKRITFLEALKRTVAGQVVQTTEFGRTILLAGLLNVSFHGKRSDLQERGIGNIEDTGVGGKWRPDMAKAIDSWKRNSEHARPPGPEASWQAESRAGGYLDSNIAFFHRFAHMAIHTDFLGCQIFAGAKQCAGRKVDAASRWKMESTMKSWAQSARGRDAAFHALCLLRSVLIPEAGGIRSHGLESLRTYSFKTDTLIYRPWVVYLSALALWSYAFALEGPPEMPSRASGQRRTEAVLDYFGRFGELPSPVALATTKGLNHNTPILEVLREAFQTTSWEFLRESSALVLGNCIRINAGGALR